MTDWIFRARTTCRICDSRKLVSVLDFGDVHISDFPNAGEPDSPRCPLHVIRCATCGLVQLEHTTNPDFLYRTYWYRSGTNQSMRDALRDITRAAERVMPLHTGDIVVDTGSNDNTLLRSYETPQLVRIGFEPSKNIATEAAASDPDIRVINDYFRARPDLAGRVRVLTSVAMFYYLDDPHAFVEDVKATLADDGLWIIQLAYLPYMLRQTAFDGVCHEHHNYYSLHTIEPLLAAHDMHIVDAELVDVNEGSIRLYIRPGASGGTGIPSKRLEDIRAEERKLRLDTSEPYTAFETRVRAVREKIIETVGRAVADGKTVHGYGASTKGNTTLQLTSMNPGRIKAIWERQPVKWGRETVGTRIPIISEDVGRLQQPDFLLILPWHFAGEFIRRENAYLERGGRFIIPLPEFKII